MSKKRPARDAGASAGNARRAAGKRAGEANPARPARDFRPVSRELRGFAMGLPGATEDFPWGDRVAKVNGKVFVFLGLDPVPGGPIGLSLKLPASGQEALDLPFTKPTGYGLGKSGWVSATFEPGEEVPLDILKTWILESYQAIAPKKLRAALEGSSVEISQRPIASRTSRRNPAPSPIHKKRRR
jgi:predicted DNA-binding protein (MmcQ/YjbR family)